MQTDFGGRELRAVAFYFYPYSIPDYESGAEEHGGIEYNIASTIAESLNFRLVLRAPSTGGQWGYEEPKGSGNYTGSKPNKVSKLVLVLT